MSTPYTYEGYDLYSNYECPFCGKNDIIKDMIIATIVDGVRVYPIDPANITFLCEWCAHFDSKEDRDEYTEWLLNELQYLSAIGESDVIYNGVI